MTKLTLEELLKPTTMTCAQCGGTLHIIPVKKDLGKGRFSIETINICGKCTFPK
jgi:hypothetical protein